MQLGNKASKEERALNPNLCGRSARTASTSLKRKMQPENHGACTA